MSLKEQENFLKNVILIVDHTKIALIALVDLDLQNKSLTFEQFLNKNRHEAYHLCYNRSKCCQCVASYMLPSVRVIFPAQLELLYDKLSPKLACHGRILRLRLLQSVCCSFAHTGISTNILDISLARCILTNFCHEVFWYSCLKFKGNTLEDFLNSNKHTIYHLLNHNINCCMCQSGFVFPCDRPQIIQLQWNNMFSSLLLPCTKDRKRSYSGTTSICSVSATPGICIQHLDLNLQKVLLQYCCPLWKSVIDLCDIKTVTYIHAQEARMSEANYEQVFYEIENILTAIASVCGNESEVKQRLHNLKKRTFVDQTMCLKYQNSPLEDSCSVNEIQGNIESSSKKMKSTVGKCGKEISNKMDELANEAREKEQQKDSVEVSFGDLRRVPNLHSDLTTPGTIPEAILKMDAGSVQIYMNALRSGSEIKHDIRVIVVGKKGAGKTSLTQKLLKQNVDISNVKSTNGIDIHVNRCKIRTADGVWVFKEENFKSEFGNRVLKSMIKNHTRNNDSPDLTESVSDIRQNMQEYGNEKIYETLEGIKEENTSKQSTDSPALIKTRLSSTDEEQTCAVENNETHDLTFIHEKETKATSSSATDFPYDTDIKEIIHSASDMDGDEYAALSVWDFAGDKEFYNTHQTFLSHEAIYLVVTKLNETDNETDETFKFWFDSIHFYGVKHETNEDIEQTQKPDCSNNIETKDKDNNNGSTQAEEFPVVSRMMREKVCENKSEPPIIAVGTHKDLCTGNFKEALSDQIRDFLGDSVTRQHLRGCRYISNTTDEDDVFEALRKSIFDIAKNRPNFGKLMPTRFIKLEKFLFENLQSGKHFLSFVDVKEIALNIGAITDIDELDVFLRYHHAYGNIVYFKDIPEYIILNPQWLVNAFRVLVTADEFQGKLIWHRQWNTYEETGKLNNDLLNCIFENQTDDIKQCKGHILSIMEKFDIIVRPRMLIDGIEQVQSHYYVPCMIKTIASFEVRQQLKTPKQKSYCLCLEFNYLPPVFINHLVISCIRKYPVSQFRGKNKLPRPALFRNTALFDINTCEKLFVASCQNFIQIQIWKFDARSRLPYIDIRSFILAEVNKIINERYRMVHIKYEENIKCENTNYDSFEGIIKHVDIKDGQDFFCEEHDQIHSFKDDWLNEKNTGSYTIFELNFVKMGKVALNILADALFDLLKLDTCGNPTYNLRLRDQCDITFLYGELRRLNKNIPSNSSNRRCPWGGEWKDIAAQDIGVGDDIERIRLTRNELQHSKYFALDTTRYNELCTILQDLLCRFEQHNKPTCLYTDRLNEILQSTFESENVENTKQELKNEQYRETGNAY